MLTNTFQHLKGVGKKTERTLWGRGVLSWDAYARVCNHQLAFFEDNGGDKLKSSFDALQKGDMSFFARCLPCSEFYRVAITYPDETLFLDIETTGLSLYYDQITVVGWSLGRAYGLFVRGRDPSGLLEALKSAKAVVTFNGTLFDLKFLEKEFRDIHIPPIHVDLRFLAKRVGLSGGQKSIETQLGFKRPHSIKGMEGESAPILWFKYRRGDLKSFKRLVRYNHSDIEGMKFILDHVVSRVYEQDNIPKPLQSNTRFSKFKTKPQWEVSRGNGNPYTIHLSKYEEALEPLIRYGQLNDIVPLSDRVFIGIDLVSSEERESGYCILNGNQAKASRIKTDDEMIQIALDAKATLISIDSPLSIPAGRTSFFDDDPARDKYGIMRQCERILKKRGINVYPCLIPSMQKLTRRGIALAQKFRRLGIPVIESYPGAAQDIIGIPRKRAGLKYLAEALEAFGILFESPPERMSHDELDAVTSAIVGVFFWTGMFEGIGNPEEEYLIIPDLNADHRKWIGRKVIGLSGPIAAGKTTAANFLIAREFHYGRYSLVLKQMLNERGIEATRNNLQQIGGELNREQRQQWLCKKLIEELPKEGDLVIDGLRHPDDHAFLAETFGLAFVHVHVKAPESLRLQRFIANGRTEEEFKEAISHPVESNVSKMADLAHATVENTCDIDNLKTLLLQNLKMDK